MVAENPTWVLLAFTVSSSCWVLTSPREPSRGGWSERPEIPGHPKGWSAFLENHKEEVAAMDFFTVPTITFGVLYGFFVISHDRRRILHFNVTKHPTSTWIIQQLREAFPFATAPRFLIHDRDAKYGTEVPTAIRSLKITAVRDLVRKSLAEWCRRALGGQLP
jgi:hypothetical protein